MSKSKCAKHSRFGTFLQVGMLKKVHAFVAQSTFRSQTCKSTTGSDHFWRFGCGTRRCGAKHISKLKCTKHTMLGALLEVEMTKKCTPMWHEAHFEVKRVKTTHARTTFGSSGVKKVHAVVARSTCRSQNCESTGRFRRLHAAVARSTSRCQNGKNTLCSDHF